MAKSYKDKQNQLKIANDQYNVALKEIQKSTKSPKENAKASRNDTYISEAINFEKQRKILDKNMKNIQSAQNLKEEHASELAQQIFEELTENINNLATSQKILFKAISDNFVQLNQSVKKEITSSISEKNQYAVQSYKNTLIFNFKTRVSKDKQEDPHQTLQRSQSLITRQKSANFLYEDDNENDINQSNSDNEESYLEIHSKSNFTKTPNKPYINQRRRTISSFQSPTIPKGNIQSSIRKSMQCGSQFSQSQQQFQQPKFFNNNLLEINKIRNEQSLQRSSQFQKRQADKQVYSSNKQEQPLNNFMDYQNKNFINSHTGEEDIRYYNICKKEKDQFAPLTNRTEDNSKMIKLFHSNQSQVSTPMHKKISGMNPSHQTPFEENNAYDNHHLNYPSHQVPFAKKQIQQVSNQSTPHNLNNQNKQIKRRISGFSQQPEQEDDFQTINEFLEAQNGSYTLPKRNSFMITSKSINYDSGIYIKNSAKNKNNQFNHNYYNEQL